jgi:hypothetical protein
MRFRQSLYVGIALITLLFASLESKAGFWVKKAAKKEAALTTETRNQLSPRFSGHIASLERLEAYTAPAVSDTTRTSNADHKRNLPAVFSLVSALLPIAAVILGAALGGAWGAALFFLVTILPGSILAVVLGIIGLKRKRNRNLALTGLIMGGILFLVALLTIIPTLAIAFS